MSGEDELPEWGRWRPPFQPPIYGFPEDTYGEAREGLYPPESNEVRDELFWRDGGGFRWCWPRFNRTTPADKRPRFLLNRYPHNVMVVVFGHGWGVRWKTSRQAA